MGNADLQLARETPTSDEVTRLLAERDAYFDALYEGTDRNARSVDLDSGELLFFTARTGGALIGCGALIIHPGYGELKRFFVRPDQQGRGVGRRLVRVIEQEAHSRGLRLLRLETGVLQPAAIALYRSEGFTPCGCFGDYGPDPLSVFMEKRLDAR